MRFVLFLLLVSVLEIRLGSGTGPPSPLAAPFHNLFPSGEPEEEIWTEWADDGELPVEDDRGSPEASTDSILDNTAARTEPYLVADAVLGRSFRLSASSPPSPRPSDQVIYVTKRNGQLAPMDRRNIYRRLEQLVQTLDTTSSSSSLSSSSSSSLSSSPSGTTTTTLNLEALTETIVRGLYPGVSTSEISALAAESAASMATQHADYARLAARLALAEHEATTPATFSQAMRLLYQDGQQGFLDPALADWIQRRGPQLDRHVMASRREGEHQMTYFGFKTLHRAYLLRTDDGVVVERPQYLWMRVALGLHGCGPARRKAPSSPPTPRSTITPELAPEEEEERLQAALETYDLMSQGYFTHASPTLFHAGTTHPQLASCFLVQMSEDSIQGIYDTLKQCAVISKAAGGIGLSVHNIRARGSPIRGTRGVSNGLVPMLRVYDVTSRYVDQGGGKRPGAFAIYLEPWHADIFDVLNLKKNHGKEEQRARDLFYGLWIPDLFMKRVHEDGMWSLMCPNLSPGLAECFGVEFDDLYHRYEREGRFLRQVRARDLWVAILESQIETGTPYMCYKDACNSKSNQQNLGTIQCSNLCTEIVQYTSRAEVAVCNLASLCLSKFVVSSRGPYGSVHPESGQAYFDHEALHRVAKIVTRNLNRIIDINSYPVEESRVSNLRHRPIGIGVSGLADVFIRLGLPFTSPEAKILNEAIFETIYHAAVEASCELAEVEGPYETFSGSPASLGKLQYHLWGTTDDETPSHKWAQRRDSKTSFQRYPVSVESMGYDWAQLRNKVMRTGLRNSLLVAPMPTASTSQILGVNECFEPFSSNLYIRRVKAGEFIMANPHLLQDLTDRGLWTSSVRNQLMRDGGSVQNIPEIPGRLKEIYKTVWELKMKDIIEMAADRGKFIDQSQSLNLFVAEPSVDKLTAMHFYAWRKGLKTGMYYLRTKPAVNAIQYTVDKTGEVENNQAIPEERDDICLSCQA